MSNRVPSGRLCAAGPNGIRTAPSAAGPTDAVADLDADRDRYSDGTTSSVPTTSCQMRTSSTYVDNGGLTLQPYDEMLASCSCRRLSVRSRIAVVGSDGAAWCSAAGGCRFGLCRVVAGFTFRARFPVMLLWLWGLGHLDFGERCLLMTKGSDLFVAALENEGVERIFGVPGEENLDTVESLRTSSIELVVTRHEQSAAFMAATYGRLTGRPGVCISTLGPGALNLATGAAYAHLGAMPMILITGQKAIQE